MREGSRNKSNEIKDEEGMKTRTEGKRKGRRFREGKENRLKGKGKGGDERKNWFRKGSKMKGW